MTARVGGPNQRSDYHDDPLEELFFQLSGNMVLRLTEEERPRDLPTREGDVFLLTRETAAAANARRVFALF